MKFFLAVLRSLPVLGWFIKDAERGDDLNKILFVFNFAALWLLAISVFGYPALIVTALAMVPIVFLVLIEITARDAFPATKNDA